MKTRSRTGFAIFAVLVLVVISWLTFPPADREPSYQGKPLSGWLREFDTAQGSAEYAAAQSAMQHFGTNVVPRLIYYLRRRDPPFYAQWLHLKSQLNLLRGEVDYAVVWQRRAAHACGALGPVAAACFPALTEAMNEPGASADVGNGLSRMMPSSVPVLTNVLATGSVVARCRAADNLVTAFSHPEAEGMARTALISALQDSDRGVRMAAASAFRFWNTHLEVVVPELTRVLSDPDPSVRGNAATSLGNFGSPAKAAIPALQKLLQDTNPYVSGTVADRAAEMMSRIDPAAAVPAGAK